MISSLDPTLTLQMLKRIGVPYLAVAVFLVLMQVGVVFAGRAVNAGLMPLLAEIVMSAVSIWGIFAAFHLLGQLVHEYRDVLGHEDLHDPAVPPAMATADQCIVDQARRHIEDGRPDRARDLLRADVPGRAAGLAMHETYHDLLSGEPWDTRQAEHYRLYIGRLLTDQQGARALVLLRKALETDPGFAPKATHWPIWRSAATSHGCLPACVWQCCRRGRMTRRRRTGPCRLPARCTIKPVMPARHWRCCAVSNTRTWMPSRNGASSSCARRSRTSRADGFRQARRQPLPSKAACNSR